MYTTDFHEQIDQQSMMSRFYSVRTQGNTQTGADFENFNTHNSLSDPYALGEEKLMYLKMNYRRLYGSDPQQKVFRYTGQMPGLEERYASAHNGLNSRYTHEDYRMLGDILYKGIKGMIGVRADPLPVEQQQRQQAARVRRRMAPADNQSMRMPAPDQYSLLDGELPEGQRTPPVHGAFQGRFQMGSAQLSDGVRSMQNSAMASGGDHGFGGGPAFTLRNDPLPTDTNNLFAIQSGIEGPKRTERMAGGLMSNPSGITRIKSSTMAPLSSSLPAASAQLSPPIITSGSKPMRVISRASIRNSPASPGGANPMPPRKNPTAAAAEEVKEEDSV